MMRMIFAAMAALTLAACGDSAAPEKTSPDALSHAVDGDALATAVDRAIDEKALEQAVVGTARGAVRGAVEDAIQDVVPVPSQEMKAIGAAVDGGALIRGIGGAVNEQALGDELGGAVTKPAPAR